MQISSTIGALYTINKLAVNLLGQDRKKMCQMCGVVPGQCAPMTETGRPFQTPAVFRHNQPQTQSAESISSEQPETQAALPSATLPLRSIVPWRKGRWNTLFITGVSPVPAHRHTKKAGCFLFRTCVSLLKISHWPTMTQRLLTKCPISLQNPGYRLTPMTIVIALHGIRLWNKHSLLPLGDLWGAVRLVTVTCCAPRATEEAVGKHRDKTQSYAAGRKWGPIFASI